MQVKEQNFEGMFVDPWYGAMPEGSRVSAQEPLTTGQLQQLVTSFHKVSTSKTWTLVVVASWEQVSTDPFQYDIIYALGFH